MILVIRLYAKWLAVVLTFGDVLVSIFVRCGQKNIHVILVFFSFSSIFLTLAMCHH